MMTAKQVSPITGVMYICNAGRIEMNVIDTPASVPSNAARGVILRTIGAMNPPIIRMKLWKNTQTRPASQPFDRVFGLGQRDRQHDHERDDEHVRHADARGQRANIAAAGLLRQAIGEKRIVECRQAQHEAESPARCGRTRSSSGILITKRNKPVSTSMLTKMLVPKPKKALKSPGVHIFGRNPAVAVAVVNSHAPPCVGKSRRSQRDGRPGVSARQTPAHRELRTLRSITGSNSRCVDYRSPFNGARRVPIGSRSLSEVAFCGVNR